MPIKTYSFDRALASKYLDLCYELYRGDTNWVPPARRRLLEQFSPGFGFHRQAGSAHLHFLATVQGKPVGHASAMVNSRLKDRDGTAVGTIGFFECVDDPGIAAELLGGARDWLRAEHGLRRIWGPMQFDIWHGYRLMTRGFETATFFGEPYNKPYYPAQFAASGFTVRKSWFSLEVEGTASFLKLTAPLERDHARALEDGYRILPMDIRDPALVQALHAAVEDSYRDFLGITRIDLAEFREIFAGYARGLDPRFALAAWSPTGELGGFMIAYPDYARALQVLRGRRSPLGLLRFWVRARSVERAVGFMIGITAQESARGHHLGRALAYRCLRSLMEAGFESIVFALLAEDSPAWLFFEGGRLQAQREYALYEGNLE
jgi:hypothetical protein